MQLIANAFEREKHRNSYFELIKTVFSLDFEPVYNAGYLMNSFIPYTYFDEKGIAVSTVGVLINYFEIEREIKRYIQISTVATLPEYRNQGLSAKLMDYVLEEWVNDCDCIYLMANDSVVDFYPKFGFERTSEYIYSKHIKGSIQDFKKLNLENQKDVELLLKKHQESNPYSSIKLINGVDIMMFHCLLFLKDCIYYLPEFDTVVIATQEKGELFVYDIYGDGAMDIDTVLGTITLGQDTDVVFGFTPKENIICDIELHEEEGTTFFVLEGTDHIFTQQKITLPYLSRA